MSRSNPPQHSTEQIQNARENLIQGNSDEYFPTMRPGGKDPDGSSSLNSSDISEDLLGQSSDSTSDSPSSMYTPRPFDRLPNPAVRVMSVDSQALLQPPSGSPHSATPDVHLKPILKQSLTSLLVEKRSSLHDILSTSDSDRESWKPHRVCFADDDEFSSSTTAAEIEDPAPSVSEFEDSTSSEQRLRGITRMLFFELERRLNISTPIPSDSRNPLPRSSSLISVPEQEPVVDFIRVVPWDDREHRSGRGLTGRPCSWKQVKNQVFSWCNRHNYGSCDGGPKRMVELRTLPVNLQDWILEFERNRIEQTQGHGKGEHPIVHIDVSRVLNSS